MLARCDSFTIQFGRASKQKVIGCFIELFGFGGGQMCIFGAIQGPKPGSISFTFKSISSAREAFTQAQKMRVDGQAVKVEACPAFCECVPSMLLYLQLDIYVVWFSCPSCLSFPTVLQDLNG